jgi:hypothetical protein
MNIQFKFLIACCTLLSSCATHPTMIPVVGDREQKFVACWSNALSLYWDHPAEAVAYCDLARRIYPDIDNHKEGHMVFFKVEQNARERLAAVGANPASPYITGIREGLNTAIPTVAGAAQGHANSQQVLANAPASRRSANNEVNNSPILIKNSGGQVLIKDVNPKRTDGGLLKPCPGKNSCRSYCVNGQSALNACSGEHCNCAYMNR